MSVKMVWRRFRSPGTGLPELRRKKLTILYTLLAALLVGLLLNSLKVPGGMMIGAAIGACAVNLALGSAHLPPYTKTIAQMIVGAFIGAGVSREDLRQMRQAVKPAAIVIIGMLLMNLLTGYLIHRLTSLDLVTALLGTTPGGISDMPIIAADMGADASKVLVMQFIRFAIGVGLFPSIIGRVTPQKETGAEAIAPAAGKATHSPLSLFVTLAAAAGFGLLGKASGIPAGTMAFAALGSIVLKYFYPQAGIPRPLRRAAQCLSGAFVGSAIGWTQVRELVLLPLPVIILLVSMLAGTFLIGKLLVSLGCFTARESLLAATPAGASDMALISADLGVRNFKLVLIHLLRVIFAIALFPSLLSIFVSWLR